MIFRNKSEIARYLWCGRPKIYRMIERWEIKEVHNKFGKAGYVIVLEFIQYLVKN